MQFTTEQMNKAKSAKSVEELLAFAKESGVEMTEDEAKKYFADLHKEGELADDELENVSGGCGQTAPKAVKEYWGITNCPFCSRQIKVTNTKFDNGDYVADITSCPCGASVTFYYSSNIFGFVKNGEERDADGLSIGITDY